MDVLGAARNAMSFTNAQGGLFAFTLQFMLVASVITLFWVLALLRRTLRFPVHAAGENTLPDMPSDSGDESEHNPCVRDALYSYNNYSFTFGRGAKFALLG